MAGLLLVASENLRQGLRRAFAYQRLWGDGERFVLKEVADGCAIVFRHPGGSALARAVLAECALVETMEAARALVTPAARPIRVELVHSTIGGAEQLSGYFGVPAAFGRTENAIVFDAELMALPLALRGELLRSAFERQCARGLQQLHAGISVTHRVQRVIADVVDNRVSIAEVAARLQMSRRTLQRKLRIEGTSFQQVLEGLRRRQADALIDAGHPKKETALRLGYSDPSGLLRARRRWRATSDLD